VKQDAQQQLQEAKEKWTNAKQSLTDNAQKGKDAVRGLRNFGSSGFKFG